MKKIMLLTILMCQMLWPLSVPAQGSGPSRMDGLLLRDSMLVLWSMGLKEGGAKSQDMLCRDALFFVILSEGTSACGVERSRHPEFFQGIPENYEGFVPKQKVEEVARSIFAQEVREHIAPEGTSFDGKGYFLDFAALSDKTGYLCHLMPEDRRHGHVYQPIAEPITDTSWTVYARLLRIMKDADGGVLVMKSASFEGEVQYQDGKLQIRSFRITEQATD